MSGHLKEQKPGMCIVVTVLPCDHADLKKESPEGCCNCGMLDWLEAFDTEEECNAAYIKQHPEKFINGVYRKNGKTTPDEV